MLVRIAPLSTGRRSNGQLLQIRASDAIWGYCRGWGRARTEVLRLLRLRIRRRRSVREKALIALAVSHAVQCPYCIDAYSSECLKQGADLEEMTEAVHVATAIRGGASLVHGLQMMEHVTRSSM